jgi:hypothetical protein
MEEEVLKHQEAEWKHLADIEKIRQVLRSYSNRFGSEGLWPQLVCCAPFPSIAPYFRILYLSYPKIRMAIVAYPKVRMTIVWYPDVETSIVFLSDVRNNASHCVIWRFSLGNTWHELAAPLWVLSASIPI